MSTPLDTLCEDTGQLAYALTARPSRAVAAALVCAIIANVRMAGTASQADAPPVSDTNGSPPEAVDAQLSINLDNGLSADGPFGCDNPRKDPAHADTSA
jgi:hypothetical protein